MDIHEYQAKQLLSNFGVNIPPGEVVYQTHEAENILSWLNEDKIVVKAQVHAGGRGKAGGVKVCKSDEDVVKTVDEMIGMNIVTPQTGESGKTVRRVYLEKAYNVEKEFYFCITVDRETGGNTIVYSKKGGVNIEEVAEKTPDEIYKLMIAPGGDLLTHHARTIVYNLGLSGKTAKSAQKNILLIYKISKIVANIRKIKIFSENLLKFTKSSVHTRVSFSEYFVCKAGGKPSTWLPPVGLAQQVLILMDFSSLFSFLQKF